MLWVPPVSMRRRLWGDEGVCVCGAGLWLMSHRRMPSRCVSWRVSRRCLVLGRGEVAGVDSQGVECIGQHGFSCGLRHPPPRWPEAAVLHRPLAGLIDQALEGGLSLGPLSQLPELRVGPALPALSLGGPAVLGGGVGVGGCDGVVGTGGGGRPGGFLVVLFRWGFGARADVDPRLCAHGLCLGVGRRLAAAAVAGHALYVGCHRGLVGGRGRCWQTLALFWPGQGRFVGLGCGL